MQAQENGSEGEGQIKCSAQSKNYESRLLPMVACAGFEEAGRCDIWGTRQRNENEIKFLSRQATICSEPRLLMAAQIQTNASERDGASRNGSWSNSQFHKAPVNLPFFGETWNWQNIIGPGPVSFHWAIHQWMNKNSRFCHSTKFRWCNSKDCFRKFENDIIPQERLFLL